MCKLRCHLHPSVAAGWYRPLPVQRLRTVPQDERPEPTAYQAETQTGESHFLLHSNTPREGTQICTKHRPAAQFQESYIFPMIFLELFVPLTP